MLSLVGCSQAKDVLYLQDIQPGLTINLQDPRPIKLQTGDKVSISVYSRDKELVSMFNLVFPGAGGGMAPYTVDDNGAIEMPIIGVIPVRGLTRMELQNTIRYKLLASKLIRDPIVHVDFADVGFYVLGEMGSGKHNITRDHVNILEAISECGDLSMTGRRDNIMVLRTIEGQQTPYLVDITSVHKLYGSPVFYLQQNDIVYVQPNETAVNATSPMGNSWRTPMFWVSVFNVVLSMATLFTNI